MKCFCRNEPVPLLEKISENGPAQPEVARDRRPLVTDLRLIES